MLNLPQDFKDLLQILSDNHVQYMIVGGYALSLYAAPRATGDIDLFVKIDPDNAARILQSLNEFGFGGLGICEKDLLTPEQVLQLGYPPNRIDILTSGTFHQIRRFHSPIVCWQTEDHYEVIDGFHRHLVGRKLGLTHLPIVIVNKNRTDRNDRIAATIRHNRARGKHQIGAMSNIVIELKRRNWSNARIARELGMEPDEVLRLSQVTGLAEMFTDKEFSEAWEPAEGDLFIWVQYLAPWGDFIFFVFPFLHPARLRAV